MVKRFIVGLTEQDIKEMVPPIGLVKKILKLRQVSEFHSHLFEFVAITVLLHRVSFHLLLHCRLDPLES